MEAKVFTREPLVARGWVMPCLAASIVSLGACGGSGSGPDGLAAQQPSPSSAMSMAHDHASSSGVFAANACPVEGCEVKITAVTREGSELRVTFMANYEPDVSRNHLHVYWDNYSSKQVSNDAVPRFGVTQGAWVPTADNPYTTNDAASLTKRGGSTRLCGAAGDRNHDVIDPTLFNCISVASLV